MIIYRPHKGGLAEAMAEAKEFETEEEMKQYISEQYLKFVSPEDIVIEEHSTIDDDCCGWHDTKDVCIKRNGEENYIEKYGCPQCIGFYATDYERKEAEV